MPLFSGNPLAAPRPDATRSSVKLFGHPLHPLIVHFPVAYLLGGLAMDLAYLWTGDPFWARASLWAVGAGFILGTVAGLVGTADFMLTKEIRRFASAWSHFLVAVVLLGIAAANWWMRIEAPEEVIWPWGLFMSAVTAAAVGAAGMLGAKLVYDHNIGTADE